MGFYTCNLALLAGEAQCAPAWQSFLKLLDCLDERAPHLVKASPGKGCYEARVSSVAGVAVPIPPTVAPAFLAALPSTVCCTSLVPQEGWSEMDRLLPPVPSQEVQEPPFALAADCSCGLGWPWLEVLWTRGLQHEHQQVGWPQLCGCQTHSPAC